MNTQQALQQAFQHLNTGNLPMAGQLFEGVLQQEPRNFAALNGRGFIALQQNRLPESAADFQQSLAINDQQPFAHKMLGIVLGATGQFEASMQAFAAALALDANDPEIYFNRANFRFQAGQAQEALGDLDAAIKLHGSYLEARSNRANLLIQLGDFVKAEKDLDFLAGKVTNNSDIWVALGLAKHKVGKQREAMRCNERALKLVPNHPDALLNSSSATYDQDDYTAALDWAERAIAATPNRPEAHYAKAQALMAMSRFEEAITTYTRAIELGPNYAEAWMGRGLTRFRLHYLEGAAEDYFQAISVRPNYFDALINLGSVFERLGNYSEATEYFHRALQVKPDDVLALGNLARSYNYQRNYKSALESFQRAVLLNPNAKFLLGDFRFFLANTCNWEGYNDQNVELVTRVRFGELVSKPFSFLSVPSDSEAQKICAINYSSEKYYSENLTTNFDRFSRRDKRIRVAYLSSDFYSHATSYLMAEMFELHDRSRFSIIGVSYGNQSQDEMRKRIADGFDRFIEVENESDKSIAQMLREIDVDIAVDLKGHTQDNRLGIFSERVAPIQIHYLGYPGTIGAKFIDYIVADPVLIPEEQRDFFNEKIIYLPDTYQVNDRKKKAAVERDNTRASHGLPERAFVFCCFNNSWKISPDVFDVWMRLLYKVKDSVLWLIEDNNCAPDHLRNEACKRGIAPERLVFAKKISLESHLFRHNHADLFLDTLYYNAHTTASDALWMGLPIITKIGNTFASRVGASLLRGVGLPELVVDSIQDYEALAIQLATNPNQLIALRQKINKNRFTKPLFDTPLFTRNLETAYEAIWARYQSGLLPDHIFV